MKGFGEGEPAGCVVGHADAPIRLFGRPVGGLVADEVVGGGLGFVGDAPQDRGLFAQHLASVGEVAGVVAAGGTADAEEGAGECCGEFGDEFFGVGVVAEPAAEGAVEPGVVAGPVCEFFSAPTVG